MAGTSDTPTTGRYSLRTRTPAKVPETPATTAPIQTPRKRGRPAETSSKSARTQQAKTRARASSTPTSRRRTSAVGRRVSASTRKQNHAMKGDHEEEDDDDDDDDNDDNDDDGSEEEGGDEGHKQGDSAEAKTPRGTGSLVATPRRGPGRPRKDSARQRTEDGGSRKSWDIRRIPVHLTKHDPFKAENLFEAMRIMQQIPTNGTLNDDRYELMKMSDALKMCGYELGVVYSDTEAVNEVYRMLSWAVHAAGPNGPSHQAPSLSDEARDVLLRVFASAGRRIREETRDMAGYHRRHALRKLMLARASMADSNVDEESGLKGNRENPVHRRNPLKIPGPLVDIWREPYKKSNGHDGNESHGSDD